jgi:hypothetical protein
VNRENILHAISVMKKAKNLDMRSFQSDHHEVQCSVAELHRCGNTACFAGYMMLTTKVKTFAKQTYGPNLALSYETGDMLTDRTVIPERRWLSEYLGISEDLARQFVYGFGDFYPVQFADVKPEHVIEKLEAVLAGGLS